MVYTPVGSSLSIPNCLNLTRVELNLGNKVFCLRTRRIVSLIFIQVGLFPLYKTMTELD